MEIKYGTVRQLGSYNYCNKGELTPRGTDLIYPYTHVFQLTGNHIAIRMCESCLNQTFEYKDQVIAKIIADKLTEGWIKEGEN